MKAAHDLERRIRARFPSDLQISVKDLMLDECYSACMFNCSDTGIYFESDALLELSSEVYIGLRYFPFEDRHSDYACYRSTIIWRKELGEDSHYFYGYGTQISLSRTLEIATSSPNRRKKARRPFNQKVWFSSDHTISEGLAVDVSPSGVFIKSGKRPRVGQIITLKLPNKTGKAVVVRGRVVWSNAGGFGLNFILKSAEKG